MIEFDVFKNKCIIRGFEVSQIREYFSVANTGAFFARKRGQHWVSDRKYAITAGGIFEFGLFSEILDFCKKHSIETYISSEFKELWNCSTTITPQDSLSVKCRDYQIDALSKCYKVGCGVSVAGTGAGKTLICANLIQDFYDYYGPDFKCLMIVPNIGLVHQTFEEFHQYGVRFTLNKWSGKTPLDRNANCVLCNLQILQSRMKDDDWWKHVDCVVIDECHRVSSDSHFSKIISQIKCKNKFGFTGTLPDNNFEKWNVVGRIGPVIYRKPSSELREEKYLTDVLVTRINITYNSQPEYRKNKYHAELDFIAKSAFRNDFILKLCTQQKGNTLILVNTIEHGLILQKQLKQLKVFFVRGETDVQDRQKIIDLMESQNDIVCVAMSQIFATGINIKNLHNIIFAAGGKAFIRTVQSIGRGLRKHSSKTLLQIFDLCDQLKYSKEHAEARYNIYNSEKILSKTLSLVEK